MTVSKRRPQAAVALVLIMGLASLTDPVGAQSTADKLEAAEERYNQLRGEANEATERYEVANSALIRTQEEIAATERALVEARRRISGLQEQLDERARAAYQLGSTSNWEVLLEAQDLSEFSDRLVYLDRIAQDDADLATRVAVISEELRRLETNLSRLEEEQAVAVEKAEREKEIIYSKLGEAQDLVEQYKFDLKQEQAAALAAAGASAATPGQIQTVAGAGIQACPAPGSSFSDSFGAPRSGGRSHAGVDMLGGYGWPLYAAFSGTVSYSTSTLGGNQAYVRNGSTYAFYAHMQEAVGSARSVSAGELIGLMGDSGNAAGTPHVHWEYHPNGSLVNPTPFVSAVC